MVRRLQGRARPATGDREAHPGADQRDRGRRRQRAADGLRPRGHGGRRVHPPCRARARVGAGRRRDAVARDHGRRPAGARDRLHVRGDPGEAGRGVGARELGGSGRGAGREDRRGGREPCAQAPADDALRKAAHELLARPRLARDDQPRSRLARALDGDRRAEGGDREVPEEEMSDLVLVEREAPIAAGADIAQLAEASPVEMYYQRRVDRWDEIRALWTPLVAAVSGFCLGGGCELAMACDLIVASETAKFGQPETGLGIIPGAGGTQRLTRAVGKAVAMDVILSGRFLTAAEALAAGLVARLLPEEGGRR